MKKISELIQSITKGNYDELFSQLYGEENIEKQKDRYIEICKKSLALFGDVEGCFCSSPGRCEIGGNHTDHQLGNVLAGALNVDTLAFVVPTESNQITYYSNSFHVDPVSLEDTSIHEDEKNTTEALIRGIVSGFIAKGYFVHGFSCYAESDVLPGSGMSSSASFEVLIGTILSDLFNEGKVTKQEIAKIGQYAENTYFMKACGLMDQIACAVGGIVAIDFFDENAPVVEAVSPDLKDYDLVITDCHESHGNLSEEYSLVPSEMKMVANVFGEQVLSRITLQQLLENASIVREKCNDRAFLRAYHFLQETKRAVDEKEALKNHDIRKFLSIVNESGRSSFMYLQNVKQNGVYKTQSLAVALAISEAILSSDGAFRVHGGGFAGTIMAFVPREKTNFYISLMNQTFEENSAKCFHIRNQGSITFD